MNDNNLVIRIMKNDENAFRLIFNKLYKPLLAYVTTLTYDTDKAKDIVQNSFIVLWNKREDLLEESSIKNFLFTVCYRLYVDQYRKDQIRNKALDELKISVLKDHMDESDSNERGLKTKKILAVIEELPPRCKEILLLNKRDGVKYKEIAKKLGVSVKTVESQMRIAFQKIRNSFKNEKFFIFI
ncbi:RNA polymerase sigma factor [Aquimarina sediminis]|uniref:RNA polymerase sigma factor n=1 Tax=Aquimarina sediminis TaxID=2070536 RepID=UPI000CA01D7C|nr:RNA polymerase sigma-70 factor [Aquimarina sediminis]